MRRSVSDRTHQRALMASSRCVSAPFLLSSDAVQGAMMPVYPRPNSHGYGPHSSVDEARGAWEARALYAQVSDA